MTPTRRIVPARSLNRLGKADLSAYARALKGERRGASGASLHSRRGRSLFRGAQPANQTEGT